MTTGKLKRAAAALLAVPVIALAACSSGPSSGYVWNKQYTPAWTQYVPGYYVPQTCTRIGNTVSCSGGYMVPGYFLYWPQEWQLQLCANKVTADKGTGCGWTDVDQPTYDTTVIGSWYGKPPVSVTPSKSAKS